MYINREGYIIHLQFLVKMLKDGAKANKQVQYIYAIRQGVMACNNNNMCNPIEM